MSEPTPRPRCLLCGIALTAHTGHRRWRDLADPVPGGYVHLCEACWVWAQRQEDHDA